MRKSAISLLIAPAWLLASEPASAQFRHGFARTPSKAAAEAAWPAEAAKSGLEGWATAVCEVTPRSELTDCKVVDEHPAGAGFGAALLSLAPQFRAKPMGTRACAAYFHQATFSWTWSRDRMAREADWVAKPWAGRLSDFYPPEAEKSGMRGSAVISCTVATSGKATDCKALYENPVGAGFGAASVAMAATFQFRPARANKTAVPSRVVIPMTFTPSSVPQWNCG